MGGGWGEGRSAGGGGGWDRGCLVVGGGGCGWGGDLGGVEAGVWVGAWGWRGSRPRMGGRRLRQKGVVTRLCAARSGQVSGVRGALPPGQPSPRGEERSAAVVRCVGHCIPPAPMDPARPQQPALATQPPRPSPLRTCQCTKLRLCPGIRRPAQQPALATHPAPPPHAPSQPPSAPASALNSACTRGSGAEPSSTNWPPRSSVRQAACLMRWMPFWWVSRVTQPTTGTSAGGRREGGTGRGDEGRRRCA